MPTQQEKLEAERKRNEELEAQSQTQKSGERGVNGDKVNPESEGRTLTAQSCLDYWIDNYIKFRSLEKFYKCRLGYLDDRLKKDESFKKDLQDLLRKDAEQALGLTTEIAGIDGEFALDLSILNLYDVAVLIDDSASMASADRREGIKRVLKTIVEFMGFVSNSKRGILAVRFLNAGTTGSKIKTEKDVDNLVDTHEFGGETQLAQALNRKILGEFVYRLKQGVKKVQIERFRKMKRPLLIVMITDGEVDRKKQRDLKTVILNSVSWLQRATKGPGDRAVVFQFAGVGNGPEATKFFRDLDDETNISDVVDFEAAYHEHQGTENPSLREILAGESLHRRMKVAKLMLGPLIKRFDEHESDEGYVDDEFEVDLNKDDIEVDAEESYNSDYGDSDEEE